MQDVFFTVLVSPIIFFVMIVVHEGSHFVAAMAFGCWIRRATVGIGPLLGTCCTYWVPNRFYGWALQLSPWPYCIGITKAAGKHIRFVATGPDHHGNYGTPMDPNVEKDARWKDFFYGTIYEVRLLPYSGRILAMWDEERRLANVIISLAGPAGEMLLGVLMYGLSIPHIETQYVGKLVILSGMLDLVPMKPTDGWLVIKTLFGESIADRIRPFSITLFALVLIYSAFVL